MEKDGKVVPMNLTQYAGIVTGRSTYQELDTWENVGFDLDFTEAKKISFNTFFARDIPAKDIYPYSAKVLHQLNFENVEKLPRSTRKDALSWKFDTSMTVYGFALWWDSELAPGIKLSTSPTSDPTHWKQAFAPLPTPLEVEKGDRIQFTLEADTRWEIGIPKISWNYRFISNKMTELSDLD